MDAPENPDECPNKDQCARHRSGGQCTEIAYLHGQPDPNIHSWYERCSTCNGRWLGSRHMDLVTYTPD